MSPARSDRLFRRPRLRQHFGHGLHSFWVERAGDSEVVLGPNCHPSSWVPSNATAEINTMRLVLDLSAIGSWLVGLNSRTSTLRVEPELGDDDCQSLRYAGRRSRYVHGFQTGGPAAGRPGRHQEPLPPALLQRLR
jgi:hypothetical protein